MLTSILINNIWKEDYPDFCKHQATRNFPVTKCIQHEQHLMWITGTENSSLVTIYLFGAGIIFLILAHSVYKMW